MLIDLVLLVLPILIMSIAYGCVAYTLWMGMKMEAQSERGTYFFFKRCHEKKKKLTLKITWTEKHKA